MNRSELQVIYGGARGSGRRWAHLHNIQASPLSAESTWTSELLGNKSTAAKEPDPVAQEAARAVAETHRYMTMMDETAQLDEKAYQRLVSGRWNVDPRPKVRRAVGNSKRARRSSRWPDFGAIQQDAIHAAAAREHLKTRKVLTVCES